jgi:hypothetical protein
MWDKLRSIAEMARELNIAQRSIATRRRNIEKRHGIILPSGDKRSLDFNVRYPENNVRVTANIENGYVLVASDCHYFPEIITTAHRAFVKIIKEIKPKMVVMNGDVFDGASISRHPKITWGSTPSVKQELEACQDRLGEIEKAAIGSLLHWNYGNHDMRFNSRLVNQVGDTWQGIHGMDLKDHFPRWKLSTSLMINDNTMIKHRWHNGIHAVYNNALKSGVSIVTGHLHSLKVTPWSDYRGTRYGVDTGTLADVDGDQFEYAEDNPKNWRSGFAVLNFIDGKLMPPELCQVVDENHVYFRGELIAV